MASVGSVFESSSTLLCLFAYTGQLLRYFYPLSGVLGTDSQNRSQLEIAEFGDGPLYVHSPLPFPPSHLPCLSRHECFQQLNNQKGLHCLSLILIGCIYGLLYVLKRLQLIIHLLLWLLLLIQKT